VHPCEPHPRTPYTRNCSPVRKSHAFNAEQDRVDLSLARRHLVRSTKGILCIARCSC
jgi:hypothetical protein